MHHTNLWNAKLFFIWLKVCIVLAFSVLAFSTHADSYLRFPYLRFPVLAFLAPPFWRHHTRTSVGPCLRCRFIHPNSRIAWSRIDNWTPIGCTRQHRSPLTGRRPWQRPAHSTTLPGSPPGIAVTSLASLHSAIERWKGAWIRVDQGAAGTSVTKAGREWVSC